MGGVQGQPRDSAPALARRQGLSVDRVPSATMRTRVREFPSFSMGYGRCEPGRWCFANVNVVGSNAITRYQVLAADLDLAGSPWQRRRAIGFRAT